MFITFDHSRPIYRQIYERLREGIMSGEFPPGTRLPSTRALATELGVSRRTALVSYEQLLAEGYVVGRVGSGTAVAPGLTASRGLPSRRATDGRARRPLRLASFGRRLADSVQSFRGALSGAALRYDFRYPLPAVDVFPWVQWRRLTARCLRQASIGFLSYGPPQGYEPLRSAIAQYLYRSRGFTCDPAHIIIVGGSQQALDLTARVLVDPDDTIVIEDPQYPGARQVFAAAGARLVPIAVDAKGLDPGKLGARGGGARLAYVTPSHQFPTGAVLPLERRLALLHWAEKTGALVVEDDYDSEYRFQGHPIAAIKSLDHAGRVIYIGTFSKLVFPALRLGYLVVPSELAPAFAAAKFLADRHAPTIEQAVMAEFIVEGHFDRLLRRLRKRVAARRTALLEALHDYLGDRVTVSGTNAGIHVLLWLRDVPPGELPTLVGRAAAAGVGVYPSTPCYMTPPPRGELVLAYASMSAEDIRSGIRRLADCLPVSTSRMKRRPGASRRRRGLKPWSSNVRAAGVGQPGG
jgi:GntR family transcriptional regulator/MocR family aminotransferase